MQIVRKNSEKFDTLWSRLWEEDSFQPSYYLPSYIEYYKEYSRDAYFQDLSFIIEERDTPIIGVGMTVDKTENGGKRLSYYGQAVFYLYSPPKEDTLQKPAKRLLKEELNRIIETSPSKATLLYREVSTEPALSFLGEILLGFNAVATPYYTQVVDLSLSEEQLFRQIRKSYKSLVNWGKNNLEIKLLTSENITLDDMERFRQLHIQEAGRETRSKKTWQIQYERVKDKEAFVILGRLNNELVTAGFFCCSSKSCYYGVSASKRELFDKPLLHALVWEAMMYAKQSGCLYFEAGQQLYLNQGNGSPSKKEVDISTFKRGFGGRPWVGLDIHLDGKKIINM